MNCVSKTIHDYLTYVNKKTARRETSSGMSGCGDNAKFGSAWKCVRHIIRAIPRDTPLATLLRLRITQLPKFVWGFPPIVFWGFVFRTEPQDPFELSSQRTRNNFPPARSAVLRVGNQLRLRLVVKDAHVICNSVCTHIRIWFSTNCFCLVGHFTRRPETKQALIRELVFMIAWSYYFPQSHKEALESVSSRRNLAMIYEKFIRRGNNSMEQKRCN